MDRENSYRSSILCSFCHRLPYDLSMNYSGRSCYFMGIWNFDYQEIVECLTCYLIIVNHATFYLLFWLLQDEAQPFVHHGQGTYSLWNYLQESPVYCYSSLKDSLWECGIDYCLLLPKIYASLLNLIHRIQYCGTLTHSSYLFGQFWRFKQCCYGSFLDKYWSEKGFASKHRRQVSLW